MDSPGRHPLTFGATKCHLRRWGRCSGRRTAQRQFLGGSKTKRKGGQKESKLKSLFTWFSSNYFPGNLLVLLVMYLKGILPPGSNELGCVWWVGRHVWFLLQRCEPNLDCSSLACITNWHARTQIRIFDAGESSKHIPPYMVLNREKKMMARTWMCDNFRWTSFYEKFPSWIPNRTHLFTVGETKKEPYSRKSSRPSNSWLVFGKIHGARIRDPTIMGS